MLRASDWAWRVGVGYDFLSQQYSLDSLISLEGDSLAAMTALKTTYLDDLKASFQMTYTPGDQPGLELGAGLEQTRDASRFRVYGSGNPTFGRTRLTWNSDLEWRRAVDGGAAAGESFVTGRARGRLSVPARTSLTWFADLDADFVAFDVTDRYTRSYQRAGLKAGITREFGLMSSVRLAAFTALRQVPDSTAMNYRNIGAEIWLLGLFSGSTLDVYARVEARDYHQPDGEDDYTRVEITADHTLGLGSSAFFRQIGELEGMFSNDADPYGYDYTRAELRLLGGVRNTELSAAIGPEIGYMAVRSGDYAPEEDYREYGIATDFDVLSLSRLFCSLESSTGFRNLVYEDDTQSDYTYERLNLVGDIRLAGRLALSGLVSAEWEWHDDADENSQIFLISTNLTYAF